MTLTLIATCIVVWLLQPAWGLSTASPEPLAVLTSQLYHQDGEHLAVNMLVLGGLGYDFERHHKTSWGLLLFCIGTGTMATAVEGFMSDNHTVLLGASGSCAALCGIYMRDRVRMLIASPIAVQLLWSAFVAKDVNIAHGAHVSGLLVGVLCAAALWAFQKEPTHVRQTANA